MSGPESRPPAMSAGDLARWTWRQLTSMRVALMLLFLLALAAIPGSIIPQRGVNPLAVSEFIERNPGLARWYDRLGLFDVFSSPWFAAIYLALMVSLVGCILPRTRDHWRAMRARPPRTPRRLERMPAYQRLRVEVEPDEVLDAAAAELRGRRYRVDGRPDAVAAETGYLRETGNLVFHLALVVVLLAVALGALFGYRGTAIVQEGDGFANTLIRYDGFSGGPLFDEGSLPPFALDVDEFVMEFQESGPQIGAAADFEARVRFVSRPGAPEEARAIRVNEPLEVDGTLIHILNPGYAPAITVRDPDGNVLAEGPVAFLPQDENFTSTGVRRVPLRPGEGLGIEAIFYPTAIWDEAGPASVFPGARSPLLYLTAFYGDLGIDDGRPQSVFQLDTSGMEQLTGPDGSTFQAALAIGETIELPDGHGTVTFDGYVTWVNLQVSRNAGKEIALVGAVLAVIGLLGSLYVQRRRVWVRATAGAGGRTVVEVAGLTRTSGGDLDGEIGRVADGLLARLPTRVDHASVGRHAGNVP
ncbi:MAG TPA: cytochrome c biogenesis protein ResB [Jiangellaceae bacterium]|nr:cytochrome c biogenesis protein ResB [Jiangellaceae bacterium]